MKKALAVAAMSAVLATVAMAASGAVGAGKDYPTVAVSGGHFTFNGVPTFLIVAKAFSACPDQDVVNADAGLGAFIMYHADWPCNGAQPPSNWASLLSNTLGNRMYWLEGEASDAQTLSGMPQLVDWQGGSINTMLEASPDAQQSCGSGSTTRLYQSLSEESRQGPILYGIFLSEEVVPGTMNCLEGETVSRVISAAAFAGASGVFLITQRAWTQNQAKYPDAADRGVVINPDVKASASKSLHALKSMQSVLLSPVIGERSDGLVRAKLHRLGGKTYVTVINTGDSISRYSLRVAAKKHKGVARVVGSSKAVALKSGMMSDQLTAGSYRIYVLS